MDYKMLTDLELLNAYSKANRVVSRFCQLVNSKVLDGAAHLSMGQIIQNKSYQLTQIDYEIGRRFVQSGLMPELNQIKKFNQ